jgi:3-oxoadipate enol-lactonase
MNECPDGVAQVCPATATCAAHTAAGPIRLEEALAAFERDARRGALDTGRYRMPYFVWGSGPPLVFVHGVADTSRSFVLLISRLAARFRCVAYDLPSGHGDGARLGRYRHEDLAADLLALTDHLGLERSYLYGSSLGTTVVLRALRAAPGRYPRAILQGGLARRPLRRLTRALAWLARRLPGATRQLPRRERVLAKVHGPPFAGRPPEVWRAYVEWTGEARIGALGHQAAWLHQLDLREELPHVRQPVLLVHGERDAVTPRAYAEVLRQGLPSAGLAVIEGCGHVPYYTHPELLAELITRFLTPPGAECPGPSACSQAGGCPASVGEEGRG